MVSRPSASSPHVNATVMASAGTGKTWLLVTRLVRLLMEGVRPDAILAITFTRKAAAEMQNRLAERLFRLASASENNLDEYLREMAIDIDDQSRDRARRLYEELLRSQHIVKTTTFHAFCQDVLRRFPLEADVIPGFELEESTGELLTEAKNILISEATADPEGDTAKKLEILLEWCGGQVNMLHALDSFLSHRSDWWAFTEGKTDPVNHVISILTKQLGVEPDATPVNDFFNPQMEEALATFSQLLALHKTRTNEKHLANLESSTSTTLTAEERLEIITTVFLTQKGEPIKRKPSASQKKSMGEKGENSFLELHNSISQRLITTKEQLACQNTLLANIAWFNIGQQLLGHYQRIKREQRLLDFADLEWRAYHLLSRSDNAYWVQYKLDQRIDHLLVDEFQDTNPTQWNLLLPLLREMAAGNPERLRSIFLVGDTKQSIYRFRRAEPRLFDTASSWLAENMDAHNYDQHTSWRSAHAIMNAVNTIFTAPPLAGILHHFPEHDTHQQDLWGRITLLPLVEDVSPIDEPENRGTGLRNPLQQPRLLSVDDRYAREGELIAGEITKLFAANTLIGKNHDARPIQYSDILLLVRNRTHVAHYEQALRKAGIPYIGAERGTLLESLEVRDMVALLNTLITPYNNLALASVLRSPIFSCSDEALMLLAANMEEGENWMTSLHRLATDQRTESSLSYAARTLEHWQQRTGHIPIHDLLDSIYSEGNILARYKAAYPRHLQPRVEANLLRFIELALEIDSGRYPSLTHFLARLEGLRLNADEAPDEAPATGEQDRVHIMTIHGAKGLEAPVVFLADSATNLNSKNAFSAQVTWPPESHAPSSFLLVGRKEQHDPFSKRLLEQEQRENDRESANLLYVALTRAKQMLYISGCRPRRGKDLGWYGMISNALAPLEDDTPNKALKFESGTPPTGITVSESVEPPEPQLVPGLSTSISLVHESHEIAPSRKITSRHSWDNSLDDDAKTRGIAIHRMLELLTTCHDKSQVHFKVAAELERQENDNEFEAWWKEALALYENNALQEIFHPSDENNAFCEIPIIYRKDINGSRTTVHGIIDRLILTPEYIWIIDFKSHRAALNTALSQLASPYQEQMSYYAKGVKQLWPGRKIRCSLLFTVSGKIVDLRM